MRVWNGEVGGFAVTTSIASLLTPANCTLTYATVSAGGGLIVLNWRVSWTAATVTATSAGNITDQDILSGFPVEYRPITNNVIGVYDKAGLAAGTFVLTTAGVLTLRTLSANATIASGDALLGTIAYAPQ